MRQVCRRMQAMSRRWNKARRRGSHDRRSRPRWSPETAKAEHGFAIPRGELASIFRSSEGGRPRNAFRIIAHIFNSFPYGSRLIISLNNAVADGCQYACLPDYE